MEMQTRKYWKRVFAVLIGSTAIALLGIQQWAAGGALIMLILALAFVRTLVWRKLEQQKKQQKSQKE